MSDFAPGDVVVCVDARDNAARSRPVTTLVEGRTYRVLRVIAVAVVAGTGKVRSGGLAVQPEDLQQYVCWNPARFRKLNDGTDDAELIEKIKSCKPVRERLSA